MAASVTLTLTAGTVGRMPGCFRASALTASCLLNIGSGAVALAPHRASSFTCWLLSCQGNAGVGSGKGFVGVTPSGELSGLITTGAAASHIAMGYVNVQRTAGATEVVTGGGSQAPTAAPSDPNA